MSNNSHHKYGNNTRSGKRDQWRNQSRTRYQFNMGRKYRKLLVTAGGHRVCERPDRPWVFGAPRNHLPSYYSGQCHGDGRRGDDQQTPRRHLPLHRLTGPGRPNTRRCSHTLHRNVHSLLSMDFRQGKQSFIPFSWLTFSLASKNLLIKSMRTWIDV